MDGIGKELEADDLQSGCHHSLAQGLSSLLGFLSAFGDAYRYAMVHRQELSKLENGGLFPKRFAEWAYRNNDELSMLSQELEENPSLINEGDGDADRLIIDQ